MDPIATDTSIAGPSPAAAAQAPAAPAQVPAGFSVRFPGTDVAPETTQRTEKPIEVQTVLDVNDSVFNLYASLGGILIGFVGLIFAIGQTFNYFQQRSVRIETQNERAENRKEVEEAKLMLDKMYSDVCKLESEMTDRMQKMEATILSDRNSTMALLGNTFYGLATDNEFAERFDMAIVFASQGLRCGILGDDDLTIDNCTEKICGCLNQLSKRDTGTIDKWLIELYHELETPRYRQYAQKIKYALDQASAR